MMNETLYVVVVFFVQVNSFSPATVKESFYVDQLYRMLQDPDASVVTNAILVLDELSLSRGGIEVNQSMLMALLNRVGEFSEWGLNTILDLVSRYSPSSEEEAYAVMNLLDPVLRTANSGAVLATFKCFVKLTKNMPDLAPQIYSRIKPPVLTLVTGAAPESQFAMLKHLELILQQPAAAGIFDDEFRQIFVRYNEPPHVKHLKVELLPLVTNERNAMEIAAELSQYVTDIDAELSKKAISSLGEIAIKVGAVSVEMTQTLMELIDMDVGHVRAQAAIVIADVIRVHPSIAKVVLPYLSKCLKRVEDPASKTSLIFLLGEFGNEILEGLHFFLPMFKCIRNTGSHLVLLSAAVYTHFSWCALLSALHAGAYY
jgi:AP-4 complex subunit beta-1